MKIFHKDLPQFDEIEIYGGGDIHKEDPLNNIKQLMKWRAEILEKPYRYVILNGDLINFATKTSKSDVYNQKKSPDGAMDDIIDFLLPLARESRILIMHPGNHEDRGKKSDGIKVMKNIAARLFGEERYQEYFSDEPYLLYLSFGKSQGRECRKNIYSLYGKHGSGGGGTVGAKMNRLAQMESTIDADIYLHSHTHLPGAFKQDFIRCDYRNKKTTQVTHLFVNTNAFLKFGGYAETAGMKPASCDYPKIILNGIEREMKAVI